MKRRPPKFDTATARRKLLAHLDRTAPGRGAAKMICDALTREK